MRCANDKLRNHAGRHGALRNYETARPSALHAGVAGLLCLLLSACGEQAADNTCKAVGDNRLQDPLFSALKVPRMQRHWQSAEHAAGRSFTYEATDGVVTIEKIGVEPWMILTQSPDPGPLAGKVVEFSADIKFELETPKEPHAYEPGGGLVLMARENDEVVLNSTLDHEPKMGMHDWQTVRIVVALPRGLDYLQVGFMHHAGGVLRARNPVLRELAGKCPLTPLGD